MATRNKYFTFHASGSAFGGVIHRPFPVTIPSQAMVCLSPSGGYGTSSVENVGIKDLIYVRSATSTVQGDEKHTELTVTLEDADLLGVVKLKRLFMHMVCRPQPGAGESAITPAGSTIEGLTVHGTEVNLQNESAMFDRLQTWSSLANAYDEGNSEVRRLILNSKELTAESCGCSNWNDCVSAVGDVKATLFPLSSSQWLPIEYGGLRIKDFGTLYLGEFRISRYARQLNMLRVELGCDREGSGGMGGGYIDGHEEPPS
jgi:hypothetical protein